MLTQKFIDKSLSLLFIFPVYFSLSAMEQFNPACTLRLVTDQRAILKAKEVIFEHAAAIKNQSKDIEALRLQVTELKKKRTSAFFHAWRSNVHKKVAESRKAKCIKLAADHAAELQRLRQTHDQQLQGAQATFAQTTAHARQEQATNAGLQAQLNQKIAAHNATSAELQRAQEYYRILEQRIVAKDALLLKYERLKSAIGYHLNLYRNEINRVPLCKRNYKCDDTRAQRYSPLFLWREELCVCLRLLKGYPAGQRLNYETELTPLFQNMDAGPGSYLASLINNA